MTIMLLDTSGLLCHLDENEPSHSDALTYFETAGPKLLHSYIVAEFIALSDVRGLSRAATLAFVKTILAHPEVAMVWVDAELHQAAFRFLEQRLDKKYSLCDAVSFVLTRRRRMREALTTDHHFVQEGFERLLE
jgi:uncharacterized protein